MKHGHMDNVRLIYAMNYYGLVEFESYQYLCLTK